MKRIFSKRSVILMIVLAVVVVSVFGSNVWARIKLNQKNRELEAIREEIEIVEMDNKSIDYLLNEADEREGVRISGRENLLRRDARELIFGQKR